MAVSGCSNFWHKSTDAERGQELSRFEPLREAKRFDGEQQPISQTQQQNQKTRIIQGPGVIIGRQIADAQSQRLSLNLEGEPISGNYHNIPLPGFINEVFGEQLGLSFTLDPQIEKQQDLVTLRLAEAVSPNELFQIAISALADYGVVVSQKDGVLSFVINKNSAAGETPLLVSGRTLPEVPQSHRPVYMFVPLKVVSNNKVARWVTDALTGKDIQVKEDSSRNAVLIKGKPDLVQQALAIIEVLDQPFMRGKFSASIEPAYVKVGALSKNLKEVLNAEGYDASLNASAGSIILIPLEGANQLVVFAASQSILDHVKEWVEQLDRRQQLSIDQGIFTYEVRNTDAAHIVELMNAVENGGQSRSARKNQGLGDQSQAVSDTTSNKTQPANEVTSAGNFVVDTNRNTIIFKGSGQSWLEMLPVIQSLDKAAPSVLIEVLLAEVTLNDSEQTGFEFLAHGSQTINGKSYGTKIGTLDGLGLGASGLSAVLDSAGETRAVLNLFYENKRAEIRSRPRLMVKSGQEATIDVGTEVPTITSSAQSTDTVNAPVLQDVAYRKTGVRLTVLPVVHASGHVDIQIDQQLSEAQSNQSSGIDSPSIFNRQIQTVVTLQDGGSILLGGLISSSKSNGDNGVPLLGKLPILGRLFKADNKSAARTELMVMIIPYVINSPSEGQAITKSIQQAFQKVGVAEGSGVEPALPE
ncbi:secretin N-terminal domain-containing protein [Cellvibrio sp. UBA7671]|uniref:secretin N-terminal domain-containing protein n=1 Tax=Cellvibrio sp. UBA7671 TaxID=1946312 RepID=UPI002F360314